MVISSHSFKGGSGRTSSTANLAAALANKGKNVCLIDMDLEGAGLSVVLGLEKHLKNTNISYIQDYLLDEYPDDFDYKNMILNVNKIKSDDNDKWMKLKGTLFFIPARIEFNERTNVNYDDNLPARYLSHLLRRIELDPDFNIDHVILDSASGYCDAAITSLMGLLNYTKSHNQHHLLLLFTRWSNQHIAGTIKVGSHFNSLIENKGLDINYEVVANVIPFSLSNDLNDVFKSITKYVESKVGKPIFRFIPENDDMKWNERIIVFDDDKPQNADVISAYNQMADQIINNI